MEKTPVTILQEMMVKLGENAEYECIAQSGPQHQALFEYVCRALGASVSGTARTKKDAKQEAARHMLAALAARGAAPATAARLAPAPPQLHDTRSYVALLREFCIEYHLPPEEFSLVGDAGPAHLRHFTVSARVGAHVRSATATTKKAARQLAAEQLYTYLKENLSRITKDFVEEDALVRAHERAMERYEATCDENPWRPDLGLPVADYHRSLLKHIEKAALAQGLEALSSSEGLASPERVARVAEALGLRTETATLAAQERGHAGLAVLLLAPSAPELAFAASDYSAAADKALAYFRDALTFDS